jgi:hypothetical protein
VKPLCSLSIIPSTLQNPELPSSRVSSKTSVLLELEEDELVLELLLILEELEELELDELVLGELLATLLLVELLLELDEEELKLLDKLDELLALILPAPAAPPTILGISAALSKL